MDDIATDVVAQALQGLISIIKETGEILPSASFDALDNSRKILVYLLGLRACALLNLGDKRLHASPDEIADFIGRSTSYRLVDEWKGACDQSALMKLRDAEVLSKVGTDAVNLVLFGVENSAFH